MLNVVAISDVHGAWDHLGDPPPGDIMVLAGDMLNGDSREHVMGFLRWCAYYKSAYDKIIYVPGNHDEYFDTGRQLADPRCRSSFGEDPADDLVRMCADWGVTLLIDRAIEHKGYKIWGTPWSNRFGAWSFMAEEPELKQIYEKLPLDLDLVISHGPPKGYCDRVSRHENVGSTSFVKRLEKMQNNPAVICGHIHECGGKVQYGPSFRVYNVAAAEYVFRGRPDCWTTLTVARSQK